MWEGSQMTANEFQHKYREYCVTTREEAEKELASIEVDEPITVLHLSPLGYVLMLKKAADFLKDICLLDSVTSGLKQEEER
jgi:hypothetical protein